MKPPCRRSLALAWERLAWNQSNAFTDRHDANNAAMPSLSGGNDVAIYRVPEPSSLVLFAMGAIGVFAYITRRRTRTA